jgi:hypothetical protein
MSSSDVKQATEFGLVAAFEHFTIRGLGKLAKARYRTFAMRSLSTRNRRLIEQSGLFDSRWYLQQTPEAAASKLDPLEHYFYVGWQEGRSPSPHFDPAWYRAYYNDVGMAGWEPLLHFVRYGKSRGRRPHGTTSSIFDSFESLGDDCEFGSVQSHFDSNKLGLFRFASTNIDGLIAALDDGLDHLITDETIEIVRECGEYRTRIARYGMLFHTNVPVAAATIADIKPHEIRRLRLLVRKLHDELREGHKIFVYKSTHLAPAKIAELAKQLRRYGPNRLLCVGLTQDHRKLGTVDLLFENVAFGYLDRFDWRMARCSVNLWYDICSKTRVLWPQLADAAA